MGDMGEIYTKRYAPGEIKGDIGEILGIYRGDIGEILGDIGKDIGEMYGRYRGDIHEAVRAWAARG